MPLLGHGQYQKNLFAERLVEMRLSIAICGCQKAQPEFLCLSGKESD